MSVRSYVRALRFRYERTPSRRTASMRAMAAEMRGCDGGTSCRDQLVAEPWDREDPLRVRRIALDFSAKCRDVCVARSFVSDVGALPEVLHDLAARKNATWLAGEQREQVVLGRRERDRLAVSGYLVLDNVDG